jgi:glycosyltransferase involved in cell wall biosynthesis
VRIVIANKFAHVTGGADRHCLALAWALREAGHEVAFLSTAASENVERVGEFVPLTVTHATRDALAPTDMARVAIDAVWSRAAARAATQLFDEFRPQVIHAHKLYPQLSVAPVVLAARRRIPVVQTMHDFEFVAANPLDPDGSAIDKTESRATYRTLNSALHAVRRAVHRPRVASWTTVSRFLAEAHARRGIVARVVPNFAPFSGGPPFAERDGVVYAGRLSAEKGVEDLIELARRLPDVRVAIAGSGPLEAPLREAAASLPNVTFLGWMSEEQIATVLASHRVVVLPSHCDEGGPLAAVEAMAAATPVVAYSRGGLGEYVGDAGAGGIVQSLDQLVDAVEALVERRDEWEPASAAATAASRGRHSPEAHVAAIEEEYERAVRSTRR